LYDPIVDPIDIYFPRHLKDSGMYMNVFC